MKEHRTHRTCLYDELVEQNRKIKAEIEKINLNKCSLVADIDIEIDRYRRKNIDEKNVILYSHSFVFDGNFYYFIIF
jgi:hypothetical protein